MWKVLEGHILSAGRALDTPAADLLVQYIKLCLDEMYYFGHVCKLVPLHFVIHLSLPECGVKLYDVNKLKTMMRNWLPDLSEQPKRLKEGSKI